MKRIHDKRSIRAGSVAFFSFFATVALLALIAIPTTHGQSCGQPPPDCPSDNGDPQPICFRNCPPGCPSPIILDLNGKGFFLTDARTGVLFDIKGTGNPIQIGWTAAGVDNAFLALPAADGTVTSGKELFGNFTPQPPSASPNGYLALAVYDQPENGGNGDGVIDARDKIFSSLRLWIDANHDGIAQPDELFKLPDRGVYSVGLNYRESRLVDKYGNEFRYRGKVNIKDQGQDTSEVDPRSYDVFLTTRSIN